MEKTEKMTEGAADFQVERLRETIDEIDREILGLINKRLGVGKRIGEIKNAKENQVLDKAREDAIFKRLTDLNDGLLSKNALHHIFYEIIASSREIQQSRRVTYLGPEATFTHIAAMKHFGHSVSFVPKTSIREIFTEVEKGTCHFGVAPVENSIEGSVTHTLDLLFESNLKICSEIYHPISHDLLSKSGKLEEICVIYSHPQAFAQCREWLRKNMPDCKLEECSSTAYAAQRAADDRGTAAIASNEAGRIYNLRIVAPKIEDFTRNETRFLVIGREEFQRTGNDKTSVIFATPHVPGALYRVLQPIAAAGINMLKLESRPAKHENWNYYFYVDIEGHKQDPNVRDTLSEMKNLCLRLKWLGSYPNAQKDE